MTHVSISPQPRTGWHVISLRPRGGHAALRRAAAAQGATLIALSPWRIEAINDALTRASLSAALAADMVIATSPAAVRAAAAVQSLHLDRGRYFITVGQSTAAALRRGGVALVETPPRMDSEGLLALKMLQSVRGRDIGLLTAPGGRDRIASVLCERGARLLRADVYRRVPTALSPRGVRALLEMDGPASIVLSSGEALLRVLDALPANAANALRCHRVIAASLRLADLARVQGFADIVIAASAMPRALIAAAVTAASAGRH